MKRKLSFFLVRFFCFLALSVFAQPGQDGALTLTLTNQVLNKYSPVSASISIGDATVAITSPTLTSLCAGDLIMIYQAQGATITNTNTSAYGDISAYNSAGLYEFKYIQSVVGNTITTQTTFTNAYSLTGRTQLIKVPQYSTLTINPGASISAKTWKDTTISSTLYRFGGLVVIHASNIVNNGTITASGRGFRGGTVFYNSSVISGATAFCSTLSTQGGEKGEGIAGHYAEYDSNGGRYCMGAPANGGGGGDNHNSGGGGGANGNNLNIWSGEGVMIVNTNNPLTAWSLSAAYANNGNAITNSSGGGRGGYSHGNTNANALTDPPGNISLWNGDSRREVGGIGGRPLTNINAEGCIYFGGGGGGGDANNFASASGSPGGGIVYLIATNGVSGSGLISATGLNAGNTSGCSCDAAPGAGAGGSIVIKTNAISTSQTVNVQGGNGGNQLTLSSPGSPTNESEGPGGGGGGGFVAIATGAIVPIVAGGLNGTTLSGAVTEMTSNGATSGATGQTGTVTNNFISFGTLTTLTLSANNPLCAGATLSLSSAHVGNGSYSWIGPNSFTSSLQNPNIVGSTTLMSGTYTVSKNVTGCNTLSSSISVSIYPQHTVSLLSSSITCYGYSTGSATITATGGTGTYSYTWSGASQTGSVVSGLTAGVYTVNISNSLSICAASGTFQIIQPSALTLNISSSSPTACTTNSVILTGTTSGGSPGYTYSWTTGPNSNTYALTQNTSGTFVYTLTSMDSKSCPASTTISVNFYNTPTLSVSNISICPANTGTLSALGANTYTWFPQTITGTTFTDAPGASFIYTVIGSSAGGCTAIATPSIYVKPGVTLSFVTATINCANLGSATVTANGTSGPFSFSWTPTSQTSSIAVGLFPGTYTVSVVDAGTGCLFTPTANFAPLVPLTGTITSSPSLACHGDQTGIASIQLAGGSGSQNYQWKDILGTQTTAIANGLAAGINTVNVIDALTFCSLTQTFFISQPSAFTLNISSPTPSICLGNSVVFAGSNSGGTPGYSYTWSPNLPGNTYTASESTSGTYTYNLMSTDANNCIVNNSITLKFVDNPTLSVSTSSICPLETGSLIANGASSYSWSTGFSGNPLALSPSITTQYTVIGTALSCTSSASGIIFLKPIPTVSFSVNSQVCQKDSLQFINPNSSPAYSWNGPMSYTSNAQSITLHSVVPAMSGNYTLKVTALNSCTASITKSITVFAEPLLTVAAGTVCEGQTLGLTSNFLFGASYAWSGPSYNSSLQSPTLLNATPLMTGSYSIVVTSAQGCTNSSVAQASVVATPSAVIIGKHSNCVGSSFTLSASGGNSFTWFGPNSIYSTNQNVTVSNANIQASGVYSLVAYVGPCFGMDTLSVTVHPSPIPSGTVASPACENTSLDLKAQGASTYTWLGPHNFIEHSAQAFIPVISYSMAGNYTLAITDLNSCSSQTIFNVVVISAPVPVVKNATVCIGGAVTLTASGGVNYFWEGPGNYSSSSPTLFLPVVTNSNTGNYSLTVSSLNSCSTTITVPIIGFNYPLPTPSITSSGIACMNTAKSLFGSGGDTYFWTGPQNFSASGQTVSIPANLLTANGIYTLSVTNTNNCAATTTVYISAFPLPQATLSGSVKNQCIPFCSNFSITTSDSLLKTNYLIDGILYTGDSKRYCFEKPGDYKIISSFLDTNNCVGSSTLLINAYPLPYSNFSYNPEKPMAGIDNVNFYNSSSEDRNLNWTWYLAGNDTSVSNDKNPSWTYDLPGKYPVVLIATNSWGCSDTAIKVIEINTEFNLYVPDAFSPNGDGLNDIFIPKGDGIIKYSLDIYDRWSEKVFSSNSIFVGWDGSFRGKECKTDVYTWVISLTDVLGKYKTFTGHVTLLHANKRIDE